MTKKKKVLSLTREPNESDEDSLARHALSPSTTAAVTISQFTKELGELSPNSLIDELNKQTDAIKAGGMGRAEEMLAIQAITLDSIFHKLLLNASLNMGEYMGAFESYMKLALKAQSQSRATLEALSVIKNPPIQYVKQLNMANNQQVNNTIPRTRENEKEQTKLSEVDNELCKDTGTPRVEKKADSPLETLEEVHRATNSGGQGEGGEERL